MGCGTIGRELLRRTSGNERILYVAIGDSSGFIANKNGFNEAELSEILQKKTEGNAISTYNIGEYAGKNPVDVISDYKAEVLIDATAEQTYKILYNCLDFANIVTSNKLPIADVSYIDYRKIVKKANEVTHIFDYGTTVGAGLRIPEVIQRLGCDGITEFSGCLSGTMNYISQRLNEKTKLSTAVKEAMNPPRHYAEPDPRKDLSGEDFRRKLIILSRLLGKKIGKEDINIEPVITDEYVKLSKDDFLHRLPELDDNYAARVIEAKNRKRIIWYIGNANLVSDEYNLGFLEVNADDSISQNKESDNIIKIQPRLWRRPVTLIGPGAGAPETVTGIIAGVSSINGS
jgi:bifunctional aspartokinase / homoserine dehydrogenase 1